MLTRFSNTKSSTRVSFKDQVICLFKLIPMQVRILLVNLTEKKKKNCTMVFMYHVNNPKMIERKKKYLFEWGPFVE